MAIGLILKDDIEQVAFVGDSTYKLLDETFSVGFPKLNTINHTPSFYSGRDILNASYGTRKVKFRFLVLADTDAACDIAVGKISRMVVRGTSLTYINGGKYGRKNEFQQGLDTGDNGLVLRVNFNSNTASIDMEILTTGDNQKSETSSGYYTLKVVQAELNVERGLYNSVRVKPEIGSQKYFRECELELTCEPFFVGPSRVLKTDDDVIDDWDGAGISTNVLASAVPYPYNVNSGYQNSFNKFTIPAASIPGDVPSLIRFAFKPIDDAAQSSVVFARDAGISLLNSPSYPSQISGTAVNNIYVYGYLTDPGNYTFRVQVRSDGGDGEYRVSDDGGSTWSGYTAIVPGKSHQLIANSVSHDAYVVFPNDDGDSYDTDGVWEFESHQSYLPGGGTFNYSSFTNSLFNGTTGQEIDQIDFMVPPGCQSRYMVLANIDANGRHEYKMKVRYSAPADLVWDFTEDTQYEWTTMGDRRYDDCIVNLGTIDLSPRGMPATSHPDSFFAGRIKILVRNLQYGTTPTGTIEVRNVWLVPVQDDYSMMFAAWAFDGPGSMVFSNYDPANPYRVNSLRTWYDGYSGVYDDMAIAAIPLDGTMAGNIPYLIPGVDNTIMILGIGTFANLPDWRAVSMLPTNAKEGKFYLAIRPRYLSVPGG